VYLPDCSRGMDDGLDWVISLVGMALVGVILLSVVIAH